MQPDVLTRIFSTSEYCYALWSQFQGKRHMIEAATPGMRWRLGLPSQGLLLLQHDCAWCKQCVAGFHCNIPKAWPISQIMCNTHDSGPYNGIFIRQRFGLVGLWLEMCQAISRQLSRAKMLASTQMCLRWCVAHLSSTRARLICCGSSAHHHVLFNVAMHHSGFLMTNLTQVCWC